MWPQANHESSEQSWQRPIYLLHKAYPERAWCSPLLPRCLNNAFPVDLSWFANSQDAKKKRVQRVGWKNKEGLRVLPAVIGPVWIQASNKLQTLISLICFECVREGWFAFLFSISEKYIGVQYYMKTEIQVSHMKLFSYQSCALSIFSLSVCLLKNVSNLVSRFMPLTWHSPYVVIEMFVTFSVTCSAAQFMVLNFDSCHLFLPYCDIWDTVHQV